MMIRRPRQHDLSHLDRIRRLPCVICQDNTTTEAAHIRFSDIAHGKRSTGMGEKPSDNWVLPLCGKHHREQHIQNERSFWQQLGRDPIKIAMALWIFSNEPEVCEQIVRLGGR